MCVSKKKSRLFVLFLAGTKQMSALVKFLFVRSATMTVSKTALHRSRSRLAAAAMFVDLLGGSRQGALQGPCGELRRGAASGGCGANRL